MPVLQGNTTGSIAGIPYNIPSEIKSFSLTNKSGGSITVTVSIASNNTGTRVDICSVSINTLETYINNTPILMLSEYTIYLVTSGSVDYYFSIE